MRQQSEPFNIKKLPLDDLINLFIQLYESGVDFVDLYADNTDPHQDKLIIVTKEGYINPDYYNEEGLSEFEVEEDDDSETKSPSVIETRKLSDDDIERLL